MDLSEKCYNLMRIFNVNYDQALAVLRLVDYDYSSAYHYLNDMNLYYEDNDNG